MGLISRFRVSTPPTSKPDDNNDSKLTLFDRDSQDRNLFNLIDDEIIKLSGSEIILYKFFPSETARDDVYMEEKRKVISNVGITLYGHFEPRAIEENLTEFGVEVDNDQIFVFNKSYVEGVAGRAIVPGDILDPKFQNMKYEVFEVQEDSFEAYGIYHLQVHAKLLRDTEGIHDENFIDKTKPVGGL